MKRICAYVFVAVALLAGVIACSRVRIIPESKLSQIYAEMLMADEWVREHPAARRVADTTLFYEPIFNKYGYTTSDYIATVDKYMYKPDEFAKVFEKTKEILAEKAQQYRDMKELVDGINEANKAIRGYVAKDFLADSLIWSDTSILWHFKDTTGLRDTLAAPDSLACLDSLGCLDSLACPDSIAKSDSLAAADSMEAVQTPAPEPVEQVRRPATLENAADPTVDLPTDRIRKKKNK